MVRTKPLMGVALLLAVTALPGAAQVLMTGRLMCPRYPGATDTAPLTAVYAFAAREGTDGQAIAFRTWETDPTGWYRLTGPEGNYTLLFCTPASYVRPFMLTNIYTQAGQKIDRRITAQFDYAVMEETKWDTKPASHYWQPFVARGTSVTHVGFKLVHDGIDGPGPDSQNLLLSIHRKGEGTPDTWPQVGPTITVLNVDCGGPKGYTYSGGWNSGEVPTTPGEIYAVHLRPEKEGNGFQTFWRPTDGPGAYRIAKDERSTTGNTGHDMWMVVGTDSDGLVIPYNKRVHRQFTEMTNLRKTWTQTYVARGRGLASVIVYAACSGLQPSQNRQRVMIRLRKGGPDGPVVGTPKLAIGNANYTGDASWGTFGTVFAPGEVDLEPGQTYAVEMVSVESLETLAGHINIKGQASDNKVGFNPYKKAAPDSYEAGTAYRDGTEKMDYDLDMQIVEYEKPVKDWKSAVMEKNLVRNGNMEAGEPAEKEPVGGTAEGWTSFATEPATAHWYGPDPNQSSNRILRVWGGGKTGKPADGGFVQRVDGLSKFETYRLTGRVRCSYAYDWERGLAVGYDPTGQTEDPKAPTIVWTALPNVSGVWTPYQSDPIRPTAESISIWLRGRTMQTADYPFKADFDDFALQQVRTDVPR